uniref:BCAS3 WD40 domain-containing protein n=1 Tax=Psilocybe cubensis TaxID=181762 RepID=A0A8H7XKW3_PSICU
MSYFQTLYTKLANAPFSLSSPDASTSPPVSSTSPLRRNSSSTSNQQPASILDTLNRTIRGHMPYAPPSSVPAPPAVSRRRVEGVGAGGFGFSVKSSGGGDREREARMKQEFEREYERDGDDEDYERHGGYGHAPNTQQDREYRPTHPTAKHRSVDLGVEHEEGPYGGGGGGGGGYGYGYGMEHTRGYSEAMNQGVEPGIGTRIPGRRDLKSGEYGISGGRGRGAVGMERDSGVDHGYGYGGYGYGYGEEGEGVEKGRGSMGVGGGVENVKGAGVARGQGQNQGLVRVRDDGIVGARWDVLNDRRVLVVAYPSALQIWDTYDLKAIREVVRLRFDASASSGTQTQWSALFALGREPMGTVKGKVAGHGVGGRMGSGRDDFTIRVAHAVILPTTSRRAKAATRDKDVFEDERPLLGLLLEAEAAEEDGNAGVESVTEVVFVVYSLRTHRVVKHIPLSGIPDFRSRAGTFDVSKDFVVLSTKSPPTLHILSSATFRRLHTIHSTSLEAFTSPPRIPPPTPHGSEMNVDVAGISTAAGGPPSVHADATTGKSRTGAFSSGLSLSIANAISNALYAPGSRSSTPASVNPSGNAEQADGSVSVPVVYPSPVFALSGRLLAYASPVPGRSTGTSGGDAGSMSPGGVGGVGSSPSPSSFLSVGTGITSGISKASRRLSSSSSASVHSNAPSSASSSSAPFGLSAISGIGASIPRTQAEVGHAALRVSESVVSGMRFLGGMAVDAARSRVGAGVGGGVPVRQGTPVGAGRAGGSVSGGGNGRYISRSAPDNAEDVDDSAAAQALRERRYSANASAAVGSVPSSSSYVSSHAVAPHTTGVVEHGHYVTVLDLAPLLDSNSSEADGFGRDLESTVKNIHDVGVVYNDELVDDMRPIRTPMKIDEFNASRSQPVAGLCFAQDGTSVGVITRDGHSVKVFRLRPVPSVVRLGERNTSSELVEETGLQEPPQGPRASQVYDLYRGRTSAVVEGVDWAKDGRWVAVGTRNRTVHVFATNPYGGKTDLRSHMEGRVRNVDVIEHPMTSLNAIAKLRGTKGAQAQASAPLAFTFLSPCDVLSAPDLAPPRSPAAPPPMNIVSRSPSSPKTGYTSHAHASASSTSTTTSASGGKRSTNFQDVLLFDPASGVLSLRRLALDKQPVRDVVGASVHALGVGVTSISLPGVGGVGRLSSSSPSTKGGLGTAAISGSGSGSGSGSAGTETQMELTAKESVLATWTLFARRDREWAEIKTPVVPPVKGPVSVGSPRDWLAEGEITTGSNSKRVLPRSLYLSHQFLFHTLGEDYHALIRRYQFDIAGDRIDVRRQVEISAYSSSSPVSGLPLPGAISSGGSGSGSSVGREHMLDFSPSSPPHSHSHMHSHSIQRVSSSFDEPIASAISGRFFEPDHPNVYGSSAGTTSTSNAHARSHSVSGAIPPILPMYPNGGVHATGGSFRNAIAIPIGRKMAGIGDGVSEGVARLRREMLQKAKTGGAGRKEREREDNSGGQQQVVPLEFDEEDEDFVGHAGEGSGNVTSAPSSTLNATYMQQPQQQSHLQLVSDVDGGDVVGAVDEEIWDGGWDMQDRMAVEEQEGFYELDGRGVGFVSGLNVAGVSGGGSAAITRVVSGSRGGGISGPSQGVSDELQPLDASSASARHPQTLATAIEPNLIDLESSFTAPSNNTKNANRKTKQKRRG